jgi:HD superfamily phosphohydrolase YqeK
MSNDDLLDELLNHTPSTDDDEIFIAENVIIASLLKEVNFIKDQGIRLFTRTVLINADEEFWEAPATLDGGTMHPPDEHLSGGNVLHTKRVVRAAIILCESQERTELEKDVVISACLLHDVTKFMKWPDGSLHNDVMHPYTVDLLVRELRKTEETDPAALQGSSTLFIEDQTLFQIMRAIRSHLGPWSPIPETYPTVTVEWIVHLADALAAQIHTVIDGADIIEDRWKF